MMEMVMNIVLYDIDKDDCDDCDDDDEHCDLGI